MVLRAYPGRFRAAALAAMILASPALAGETAVAPGQAPALIPWERSFATALQRARAEGKPLLVDFWAAWCHWCHELDATTYRDPKVVERAKGFVPVKVNTEGSLAEAELAARYEVQILPTIAFVSPGGRLFLRRASFEGPDRFPATLEEARDEGGRLIAWEHALDRDARDAEALAGIGALLLEQGLPSEARELLRRARRVDGGRPSAERKRTRRLLALAEEGRGGGREASRLLQEALALQPPEAAEDAAAFAAFARLK